MTEWTNIKKIQMKNKKLCKNLPCIERKKNKLLYTVEPIISTIFFSFETFKQTLELYFP